MPNHLTRNLARYALLVCACLCLTACAVVPPKQNGAPPPTDGATITSEITPPTDTPPEATGQPPSGTVHPDTSVSSPQAQGPSADITRVEVFLSGMFSMMGFADAPQSTVYENTLSALPACVSLCWPQATSTYYRYGADIDKAQMGFSKEQLLLHAGEPYFYLDQPLLSLPARVKPQTLPLIAEAQKMNEPMQSFYQALGFSAPAAKSSLSGTPVAVSASDPSALTIIVTDLHELRMDDGELLSALNDKCLKAGRSIGVAAIMSEFAGLIPGLGANNTTFAWGAPPTGTLDFMLDYDEYKVGVSVDPQTRETAPRPFYVLVIGEQSAVNSYLSALGERLKREFSGNAVFQFETAVYGSGYVPAGYQMGGNMRYIAGQGVTALADAAAPGGVSLIELKASQEARYLEWDLDYKIHTADPRGLSLAESDFTFIASALTGTEEKVLPNLTWKILSASGDTVKLRLRLDLPEGILPAGQYTLELLGSLTAPQDLPGSSWLSQFGYDADGAAIFQMEQNLQPFDGSKTLFLSRLIDTLGKANLGRLGVAPLGSVRITLTVYA